MTLDQNVEVGQTFSQTVAENLSRTQIVMYAGASGDFVPLHYDQAFVEAAGIPTVFAQGMFTAGLLSHCLTDFVGAGQVRKFKVRFATRLWPGDVITCCGRITGKREANGEKLIDGDLEVTNQRGEPAIKGSFSAAAA